MASILLPRFDRLAAGRLGWHCHSGRGIVVSIVVGSVLVPFWPISLETYREGSQLCSKDRQGHLRRCPRMIDG